MKNTDFPDGISFFEEGSAVIPIHWPNGLRRCMYCYDWFRTSRIGSLEVYWCKLAPYLNIRHNMIANPADRPEWCPFRQSEVT